MTAEQPRGAGVVVVGAGVIGLAVTLQLCRAGVAGVLVIDRNAAPGMGSTSRANGGVRAQFSTPINIEFSRFTIDGLAELDAASAGLVGLRRVGYLFLAGTAPGVDALRGAYDVQRSLGLDVEWLSPEDVAGLAPYVDRRGLLAGTYRAGDGIVDPHGVVTVLYREARRMGASFLFDTAVMGIDSRGARVVLDTTRGRIEADCAVNAAGPAARELARMAGVNVPVTPHRRNLACTQPLSGPPEAIPMCVDVDTGILVRREAGGFLIGYSDPQEPPGLEVSFDPRFLEAVALRIGNRFSFLEAVPIDTRKCWAGLYPETTDHHAIVDAPAGSPPFIQCAGFGGHGIMHSLAAGQAVAELVRDGRCATFDLHPLRLARFAGGGLTVETAVL